MRLDLRHGEKPPGATLTADWWGTSCPHDNTTHPTCQEPTFDKSLSLRLDTATADADAYHVACLDAWALCRHAAFDACRLASLRDRELARIVDLQSRIPEDD